MVNIKEYVSCLDTMGTKVFGANEAYFWMEIAGKFIARSPAFILTPPSKEEIDGLIKDLKPIVVTYNISTDNDNNAFLYYANDEQYELEKLDATGRRFARKGRLNFDIKFIDWDIILENGFQAFSDTRTRNGLSDGTSIEFNKRMRGHKENSAYKAIGAFSNGVLNAYLTVIEVDDWVEITSGYSNNDSLKLYPNNGLFDFALYHYLREKKVRIVSYGVSSIQKKSKKDTLHTFKERVGFTAKPIKRVFITNPKYRFVFNPFIKGAVRLLLKVKKGDRNLRKLEGLFDLLDEGGKV